MSVVKMTEKYQKLSKLLLQFPRTPALDMRSQSKMSNDKSSWRATMSSQDRYGAANVNQNISSPQIHKLLGNLPPRNMLQRRWNSSSKGGTEKNLSLKQI